MRAKTAKPFAVGLAEHGEMLDALAPEVAEDAPVSLEYAAKAAR